MMVPRLTVFERSQMSALGRVSRRHRLSTRDVVGFAAHPVLRRDALPLAISLDGILQRVHAVEPQRCRGIVEPAILLGEPRRPLAVAVRPPGGAREDEFRVRPRSADPTIVVGSPYECCVTVPESATENPCAASPTAPVPTGSSC
jgi:hypothetical protein